ncbi:MAG: hypothetical protein K2H97_11155 [Prevotella sp.]|nr:hypothetical protein [Prevotella sp.]
MRLFSDKENELIKKLVEYKKTGDLKELQVARLLRKNLSFLALRWELNPIPKVEIYALTKENNQKESLDQYFSLIDFVYFIQELASFGFVKLLTLPSEHREKQRELYDREKYNFNTEKNQFQEKGLKKEHGILSLMGDFEYALFSKKDKKEYISPLSKQVTPNSFAYDLDKTAYCIIYPMPVMEDYVANDFRTIEDKRYEENKELALRSLKIANKTLRITGIALLASAISVGLTCYFGKKQLETPIEISSEQIQVIDSIISSKSISEPVEVILKDTIPVLPITF